MPKSLEQRLAHDEDLARVFEDFDPRNANWLDGAPHNALVKAVHDRAVADRAIDASVSAAREAGYSWSNIGGILGTTGQAAQQRYGRRIAAHQG